MKRPAIVLACAATLAVFLAHAVRYSFLQDDAYIFLRYAANLVDGHGPVWNPGERVEGYTSPAWLVLLAGVVRTGVDAEIGLHGLTLACAVGAMVLVFQLTRRVSGSVGAACLATGLVATDRTFAVWSTSGMETRFFGMLVLAVSSLALRLRSEPSPRRGVALGALLVLLSLTRPEGVGFSALALAFGVTGGAGSAGRRAGIVAAGTWIGGVGAHLAWRLAYYGRPLPNTFYAKVAGVQLDSGAAYFADFASSHPVLSLLTVVACAVGVARWRFFPFGAYVAAMVILYGGYVLLLGGDFMEFRLLDVLIAPAFVLIASSIAQGAAAGHPARWAALLVAGVALAANVHATLTFEDSEHVVLSQRHMKRSTQRWVAVGRWFSRVARPEESLAAGPAGAIPYFSGLRCLDMRGLSDRYVAGLTPDREAVVGHQKWAPRSYLEREGITFIVGPMRMGTSPNLGVLGPAELVVRIPNDDPEVFDGRDFYLRIGTTRDRAELVESLRERGVQAVS